MLSWNLLEPQLLDQAGATATMEGHWEQPRSAVLPPSDQAAAPGGSWVGSSDVLKGEHRAGSHQMTVQLRAQRPDGLEVVFWL